MKEYKEVPNIITGKDLDYLSDLFNWNLTAYKYSINSVDCVMDEELSKVIEKSQKIFCDSMNDIVSILEGGANE